MSGKSPVTAQSFIKSKRERTWRLPMVLRLIGLKNFIWLALLIAVAGTVYFEGTPHVLYQYSYYGTKDRKSDCSYFGYRTQTIPAYRGECPYVKLLK